MKKTATKHKTRLLKKRFAAPPRKSWLKIYSHVAYIISAVNLFLFPARANVQAAPPNMARAIACVQPFQPQHGKVDRQTLADSKSGKADAAELNNIDRTIISLRCAIDAIIAGQ